VKKSSIETLQSQTKVIVGFILAGLNVLSVIMACVTKQWGLPLSEIYKGWGGGVKNRTL
jgi:hypothetical protein